MEVIGYLNASMGNKVIDVIVGQHRVPGKNESGK